MISVGGNFGAQQQRFVGSVQSPQTTAYMGGECTDSFDGAGRKPKATSQFLFFGLEFIAAAAAIYLGVRSFRNGGMVYKAFDKFLQKPLMAAGSWLKSNTWDRVFAKGAQVAGETVAPTAEKVVAAAV
jgi:hypothetical protein